MEPRDPRQNHGNTETHDEDGNTETPNHGNMKDKTELRKHGNAETTTEYGNTKHPTMGT